MKALEETLGDLRQQIDHIDESLHDLLIARAAISEAIRGRKTSTGAPVVQPGREAEILRRLAARHRGTLPFGVVARIWREIISASAQLQQSITLAVFSPGDEPGIWDIARDHFGTAIPIVGHGSTGQTIAAVSDDPGTIGILPFPTEDDTDPWWRQLQSRTPTAPRIMARLPFVRGLNIRPSRDLLAVAQNVGDLAGFDRALIAIDCPTELSRARLATALAAAELDGVVLAIVSEAGPGAALVDIVGPVRADDPRFASLETVLEVPAHSVLHLGGYARVM